MSRARSQDKNSLKCLHDMSRLGTCWIQEDLFTNFVLNTSDNVTVSRIFREANIEIVLFFIKSQNAFKSTRQYPAQNQQFSKQFNYTKQQLNNYDQFSTQLNPGIDGQSWMNSFLISVKSYIYDCLFIVYLVFLLMRWVDQ